MEGTEERSSYEVSEAGMASDEDHGDEAQSAAQKEPQMLNALSRLVHEMRVNKYKLTAQEADVLNQCHEDQVFYCLQGSVLGTALTWTITRIERNRHLFSRAIFTGVAAVIGFRIGGIYAYSSCMRRIMAMEGSPIQGELIAILQEDCPEHPQLLAYLEQRRESMASSEIITEDYGKEYTRTSAINIASEMGDSVSRKSDWADLLRRSGWHEEEKWRRIPRIWESSGKTEDATKEVEGAHVLADPFDLIMQTERKENVSTDAVLSNGDHPIERRRSRMSAKERREYDRMQYQQRQAQRSYFH